MHQLRRFASGKIDSGARYHWALRFTYRILNDLLKVVTIFLACDKSTQVRIKDIESPMAKLVRQHR